jgi:hypothetical protein
MKPAIYLLFLLFFFSCKNNSSSFKKSNSDTVKTILLYKLPQQGLKYSDVFRIGKDSQMFVDKNSTTKVKKWSRFYQYFIPQSDTVKINGVVQKDSATGFVKMQTNYYPLPEQLVVKDMWVNLDSLFKK